MPRPHLNSRVALVLVVITATAGIGSALHILPIPAVVGGGEVTVSRPNIILVTVPLLRADRTSLHGNRRETTPFLEEFASRNVWFEDAIVQGHFTRLSQAGIQTGMYPRWNRLLHDVPGTDRLRRLDPRQQTIAEHLNASGYTTAAFVTSWLRDEITVLLNETPAEAGSMRTALGFAQGFQEYDTVFRTEQHRTDRRFGDAADWIRSAPDEPYFLWVQGAAFWGNSLTPPPPGIDYDPMYGGVLHDCRALIGRACDGEDGLAHLDLVHQVRRNASGTWLHAPAGTYRLEDEDLEHVRAHYDESLRSVDRDLRRFVGAVRNSSSWENTVVVVLGSHGQMLGEHTIRQETYKLYGHGGAYEEVIHVPMIMHVPGLAGRVEPVVELVDVAPTLLQLAGIDRPESMNGNSLIPVIQGKESPETAFVSAEKAVRTTRWSFLGARGFLFDLRADPDQRYPVTADHPEVVTELWNRYRDRREAVRVQASTVPR